MSSSLMLVLQFRILNYKAQATHPRRPFSRDFSPARQPACNYVGLGVEAYNQTIQQANSNSKLSNTLWIQSHNVQLNVAITSLTVHSQNNTTTTAPKLKSRLVSALQTRRSAVAFPMETLSHFELRAGGANKTRHRSHISEFNAQGLEYPPICVVLSTRPRLFFWHIRGLGLWLDCHL